MNAIIIAAGSGKRISKKVQEVPKSMIKVNGKPILEHQLSVLNQAGISDVYVITGPYSDKFNFKNVKYIKDQNYEQHDILGSLMEAKDVIKNQVLILYSDILFEPKIIEKLLNSKGDISIAVDMNWEKMYEGRTEHPKSEAENVKLNNNKKIIKVKKNIESSNNVGEFLGIIKLSTAGSEIFRKKYEKLAETHTGKFQQAPSLFKAYLTDFIQDLVDLEISVEPVIISGKWCEIDTMQDLKNAEKIFLS